MTYSLADLLYLMQRLRNPETGCPWDLKQDFASVLPHTLEEAYEVADAIERQDWPHVEEELGDLLFQVIFYGQIAAERQLFNTESIIDKLVKKLVRRHPHVFPEGTLQSERQPNNELSDAQIKTSWEAIKQQEKADQLSAKPEEKHLLDEVPNAFPALTRALKLQKKVSKVGFDWPNIDGVFEKVIEELLELKEEIGQSDNKQRQQEELGDLLFTIVNLSRHLGIDPEAALRGCNTRFYQRFNLVEEQIEQQGGWTQANADSMEKAWQKAKKSSTLN